MRSCSKICFFLLLISISATAAFSQEKVPRPKVVVGIVVDQMRWDYLYRFYERYSDDGFKRLLNDGFSCENTYINYVPTVTGIGHSTIYTGSVPAIHGITGNSITFNATGKTVNCVGDKKVKSVGVSNSNGERSPVNLLANTIGDELKLATNFRSKVISVSIKDRGAILPAGHAADAAYWLDGESGKWITSTYYMKELPSWVNQFNKQNLPRKYLQSDWNTLYPIATYIQSTEDNTPYEGLLEGQETPTFPVKTSTLFTKKDHSVITLTPFGNTLTLDFAKAILEEENLGKGTDTDFLAVSLSSTDAIGHRFGMNSIEIEDTYLRLDKDLANFFHYLDDKIGEGNYTVFLTADHGASQNRKFLEANKLPVNKSIGSLPERLNDFVEQEFGVKGIISKVKDHQVWFDHKAIKELDLDEKAIREACVSYIRKEPNIPFVIDLHKVGDASVPEEIKSRVINGYYPDRSGDIQYILNPNAGSLRRTGSSHGVWNPYDAKIPLLWMGWGIEKGRSFEQVHMTDIAPTLANLLRIQPPNGNIGKTIKGVIKE